MKRTLRKSMIQKRRSMELEEWKQKSHDILTRITASSLIDSKETIMIFMDFRKEVMTKPIISWLWDQGKQVVIPRVKKGSAILDLCLIESFDDMELSSMGILEPKANHDRFAAPADIDFVFMPGVAFTKDGGRLGYG
ncbi:5-formyltetrahydrofolate cyclo-ligase like protein, partial [Aduncisulcus paluster]